LDKKQQANTKEANDQNLQEGSNTSFSIIQTNDGYGYEVMVNGEKKIHQPDVPAIAGNSSFATKEDARKVARLVSRKLEEKDGLPTITRKELDSLGVLPQQEK